MHFSKTYAQLLLDLPPELRDNAIQYRQLKKLINQVVRELASLGLSPNVLQEMLDSSTNPTHPSNNDTPSIASSRSDTAESSTLDDSQSEMEPPDQCHLPRVVYEFNDESGGIKPRLRLTMGALTALTERLQQRTTLSESEAHESPDHDTGSDDENDRPREKTASNGIFQKSLLWTLQRDSSVSDEDISVHSIPPDFDNEVIIPLVSDSAFFSLLASALALLSQHLDTLHSQFEKSLQELSRNIGDSARPASSTAGSAFHPYSGLTTHAGSVRVGAVAVSKSDLYFWREIFQLYVEAEVFESVSESSRGERSVEESETRLKLFAERVTQRGLGDRRKLKAVRSREALESFLEMNLLILNLKKLQYANAEATRKILKKHAKRTALPLIVLSSSPLPSSASSPPSSSPAPITTLLPNTSRSLAHIFVQAIGETLLPIIPHIDDYACLICTSIAFKPIRLNCGHLFCVRCLVKMQKRGKGDCPMCRAPCVLKADRSNVDWALMNFMQDWFPLEAREKLKTNEKEAAAEQLIELGLDPDQACVVM